MIKLDAAHWLFGVRAGFTGGAETQRRTFSVERQQLGLMSEEELTDVRQLSRHIHQTRASYADPGGSSAHLVPTPALQTAHIALE